MNEDTQGFVKACPVCSRHKSSHHASCRSPAALACASSSLVSRLSGLRHWPAILTVVDRFSKMAHFHRGPQFTSIFWREFCVLVGASASLSSGFHPQSNGQTERMNQELETALSLHGLTAPIILVTSSSCGFEYAHNTLTCSATGLSPFQCAYGFQPPLFPDLEEEVSCPSVQAFIRRCRRTWTQA
ncbi:hypothetical protein L3Q82_017214 [Scortum barcoo]|uniref:Uncharacterized protein n=1 Tax=Scortum barcoo TaxID=214431 RepID=A0ACB8VLP1_9TELE|nr:hypothetical protein L3Q82_017214 [Scortum barcoo]